MHMNVYRLGEVPEAVLTSHHNTEVKDHLARSAPFFLSTGLRLTDEGP